MSAIWTWIGANKLVFSLGLLLLLSGAFVGTYYKGVADGKAKQSGTQAQEERESVNDQREVEQVIMRLPKNEVQKRLEIKWCRDCG